MFTSGESVQETPLFLLMHEKGQLLSNDIANLKKEFSGVGKKLLSLECTPGTLGSPRIERM